METAEINFSPDDKAALLRVADASIQHGLAHQRPLAVDPGDFSPALRQPLAAFVTLTLDDDLRGCVGTLEPVSPLIVTTANYAFAAAFSDSRFPPVTRAEADRLAVRVSILSPLEPLRFANQEELVRQIRPGVDGLLLEDGAYRGTLLPSVWDDLPEPEEFWSRLKLKAGLSRHYWSNTLRVSRYTTTLIR